MLDVKKKVGFSKYSLNSSYCSENYSVLECGDTPFETLESVNRYSNFVEDSPISDFFFEKDTFGCVTFCSDYSVIFDQKAISELSPAVVRQYLSTLVPVSSPYSNSMSDSDLLKYCKSRHIQSLSELKDWVNYLESEATDLRTDFAAFIDSIKESDDTESVVEHAKPE